MSKRLHPKANVTSERETQLVALLHGLMNAKVVYLIPNAPLFSYSDGTYTITISSVYYDEHTYPLPTNIIIHTKQLDDVFKHNKNDFKWKYVKDSNGLDKYIIDVTKKTKAYEWYEGQLYGNFNNYKTNSEITYHCKISMYCSAIHDCIELNKVLTMIWESTLESLDKNFDSLQEQLQNQLDTKAAETKKKTNALEREKELAAQRTQHEDRQRAEAQLKAQLKAQLEDQRKKAEAEYMKSLTTRDVSAKLMEWMDATENGDQCFLSGDVLVYRNLQGEWSINFNYFIKHNNQNYKVLTTIGIIVKEKGPSAIFSNNDLQLTYNGYYQVELNENMTKQQLFYKLDNHTQTASIVDKYNSEDCILLNKTLKEIFQNLWIELVDIVHKLLQSPNVAINSNTTSFDTSLLDVYGFEKWLLSKMAQAGSGLKGSNKREVKIGDKKRKVHNSSQGKYVILDKKKILLSSIRGKYKYVK